MYLFRVNAALISVQRAYRIYVLAGQPRSQALALAYLGSIYLVARDYAQALHFYNQAVERYPADKGLSMGAQVTRAQIMLELNRAPEAVAEFKKVVAMAFALKSALMEQRFLGSLAYAQVMNGELEGAATSLAQGYKLDTAGNVAEQENSLDWVAAALAVKQHDIPKAMRLIKRVFADTNLSQTSLAQREGLRTAYEVYKAAGENSRALTYLEAYKQADDKARSLAASASAALMSARFDYVNQQAQIRQLHITQEAQAATAQARLRATLLNAALLATFVILALLLAAFISIRRSRDQVRAANDDLSQSNAALEKALAARTEFLAMTSHEIRTPLNGILGMTQVLLADRALDAPMRGKIELVHGAGETMKALVDDLLDIAKMTTGEISIHKAEMDLARLLRDAGQVWQGQAQARGLRLALDVDVPGRIVEDEVRLRQIVFNLMSNAIKFTDQGEVGLVAATIGDAAGDRLRITVRDSGIGIPPEKLEEIFESFRQVDAGVTRRHGGTGLGLAICRSLARAMGGDVTVASTPGAGSTFTLDLPLERVADIAPPPARLAPAMTLAEASLLVVEANPISQSVLRSVLGAHVAAIHVAGNVDEAIRQLAAEPVDTVLADGTTLGLDIALAGRLAAAATAAHARTVLLWPQPDDALRAAAEQAGITRVIGKPIGAADLVAGLRTLYGSECREHLAA